MTATHPDFAQIQTRLRALDLYPAGLTIDTEYGPGMARGIDSALDLLERAKGLTRPVEAAPASRALWPRLPATYAWLRGVGPVPRHLAVALDLLGTLETPGAGDSPIIMGWRDECRAAGINVSGYTADRVPWCGLFAAVVMLRAQRVAVKDPLWALNWATFGVDGGQPELGDVLTFKREGGGHVAIYLAEDRDGHYHIIGGNQGDRVNIMRIDKARMYSCRQPPYSTKPASVKPYVVAATGTISRNEA